MPPLLQNFLLWLLFVTILFGIRWRRKPHALATFQFFPEEKILWTDPKVEVTQIRPKKNYKTIDLVVTNQRLLWVQSKYCEEIWDYTRSTPPETFRFYGKYCCVLRDQIVYEQTFRGQKTLKLTRLTPQEEVYHLDLTESSQPYSSIFGR